MIVLYLFLGNLRAAAIVAAIIPLALLSTFMGLRIRGLPANFVLGAMDQDHRGRAVIVWRISSGSYLSTSTLHRKSAQASGT
jgi:hypothetical protein